MQLTPQILPIFSSATVIDGGNLPQEYEINRAYLLAGDNMRLSEFLGMVGKKYEQANQAFNIYDFYAAYNLKFPTMPSTVYLMDENRIIAAGIPDLADLLAQLKANSNAGSQYAVYLSTAERTPEEMLKFKREIFQQFIYLRMYLPIVIGNDCKEARAIFSKILTPGQEEKTSVTFIGTKKAGKSSLINAILGAEYSPASSELPTPNQVTYAKGSQRNPLHIDYEGKGYDFATVDDVREYMATEFRRANNENSTSLKPMQVYLPQFPSGLQNFTLVDTPGPNLAASKGKAHAQAAMEAFKEMEHGVFVMNYSAHLTDDEIKLFDLTYKVFNNRRRHQTVIVAVNRIDEMYAADVIKSYERFADYVQQRLTQLGYENFVVVGVSAKTAVFADKIKELLPSEYDDLGKELKKLAREYKGTNKIDGISFLRKALENTEDFHGISIDTLPELQLISRVDYLRNIVAVAYNPAEHFEWIDEAFEDIWEEDFASSKEFAERVRHFAEAGDPDAMNSLGMLYYRGEGVPKNDDLSFEWCFRAARVGNPAAMSNVAYSYRYGEGTDKDLSHAVEWYKKAAEVGNPDAMYALVTMYRDGDEIEKNEAMAFQYCSQAAETGQVDAMVSLASMYFRGDCTAKDLSKSFAWNLKAAKLENEVAMLNVAYCFQYGEGTIKNITRAIEWYNKAIDLGSAQAMCRLAEMYRTDDDTEQNISTVLSLYAKAADMGESDAMRGLAEIYDSGEGVKENHERAFKWYKRAAEKGDIQAMNRLGVMYDYGDGTKQDKGKAVYWYKKAASDGHSFAMSNLAYSYRVGDGIAKDADMAIFWYKKAVESGNTDAVYDLGATYLEAGDKAKGFQYIKQAAENGNVEAMNHLGNMYHAGEGTAEYPSVAVYWYKQAAEQGNPWAMNNLAFCYRYGEGTKEDRAQAIRWYEKAIENGIDDALYDLGCVYDDNGYTVKAFKYIKQAAEKGNVEAMNRLGVMYSGGQGTEEDKYKAYLWYKSAAGNGHPWGMYNVAGCYQYGAGIPEDNEQAIYWYKKALDSGIDDEDLLEKLGSLHRQKGQCKKAIEYFRMAAAKGNADSMNYIGVIYASGEGDVKQNDSLAFDWYKKAANAGSDWGTHNLATSYYFGRGVPENNAIAFQLFREAASKGISSAMLYLGDMYRYGHHVDRDCQTAMEWYNKARAAGNESAQERIGKLIAEIEAERKHSSSSGCFITTAVCESLGKGDDCYELTTFRRFRDGWLAHEPGGKALIDEYYVIAPQIVARINARHDAAKIYRIIWTKYLMDCLTYIEHGKLEECRDAYVRMVRNLRRKYG